MSYPKRRINNSTIKDDSPIYLTSEALKRLKEQLVYLKQLLPERIAETQRTAAYGDRSDNAEYKDAKALLRRTHRQIWSIEDQLKRVVVITPEKNVAGIVQLGSTVVLELKDGEKRTFQILGPQETNPEKGRISYESPLGAALMNHKTGDIITLSPAAGSQVYTIIAIENV